MRFKTMTLSCVLASCLNFVTPVEAGAEVDVHIGVGSPYYYRAPNPYYRPYPGYYAPSTPDRRVSCIQARNILRGKVFRLVAVRDCNGQYYVFTASRKVQVYQVTVRSATGEVTGTNRL